MIEPQKQIRPEIFTYLDYRAFLADFFSFLTATNKKYSQRWIAQKAGLNSPQLLSMIVKGDRKLTRDQAEALALALKLEDREHEYLQILIELEAANHQERQMEILDRIRFQFQNGLFKSLSGDGFEYIKKWFYPALRELTSLKKFSIPGKETNAFLAQALDLSLTETEDALKVLISAGYLTSESGHYVRQEPSLRADDFASPLLMAQYHLQLLERAFQAVKLNREIRHFDSLVVAVPQEKVPQIKDKIRQFIREIDMLCEGFGRQDDVFQLSLQFFSVTGGRANDRGKSNA